MAKHPVAPYRKSLPMYDFSRGLYTVTPKERIPLNAMPYAKNVLWDEKNRVSKVFGTTALLSLSTNNDFATNPIYNLYNYTEMNGSENLIIQGIAAGTSAMKLWVLRAAGLVKATSAPVDITPAGKTLAADLRCNFATYKGKLYMLNGTCALWRWDGNTTNPTEGWTVFHKDSFERFTYLCAFNPSNPRMYAAASCMNPIRVIYSDVNGDDFSTYYNTGAQFYDFPTTDGTPITGLCEYKNSLLVFKTRHIYRVHGDPSYGVTISHESDGVGCVHHDTIRKVNDNLVVFMAEDGLWAYGDTSLIASTEDQKVRTTPNVVRLTSEIDNYWASYATPPDPVEYGTKVWSGATDFAAFTLSQCQDLTPVSTKYPAQIIFSFYNDDSVVSCTTGTSSSTVSLRSNLSSTIFEPNVYYGQLFHFAANSNTSSMPTKVLIYTTKNGTITDNHILNCYITSTTTEGSRTVPDFTKVYAEGKVYGNTDIKDGDWTTINMSYYPSPQNMYDGNRADPPLVAIVIKPKGDDSSNYVKWKVFYTAAGASYSDSTECVVNSDPADIGSYAQSLWDYAFNLYASAPYSSGTVVTNAFQCTDADFVKWRNVVVEHVDNSFNDYTLGSKLIKIEYETSSDGNFSGTWTETVNGGEITGTNKYIKFRLTYWQSSYSYLANVDSFTLVGIRVFWQNVTSISQLVGSAFWENRYLVAFELSDSGG